MMSVNVAELKAKLSYYLKYPEQGESILVTSHGHAIAKIIPQREQEKIRVTPINWVAFFKKNPPIKLLKEDIATSELVRQIRDESL